MFIYATELIIILLLIISIIKTKKQKLQTSITKITIILILIPAISFLFAINIQIAFFSYIHWIFALSLLVIIRIISPDIKKVMWALVFSGILQSFFAFYQFIFQKITSSTLLGISGQQAGTLGVSVIATKTDRILRAYGSFPHPNILGGFLAISIIICVYLYVIEKKKKRLLAFAIAPILTLGLFLTFSRSAILATIIGLILFLIFYKQTKIPIYKITTSIISTFIIMGVIFLPYLNTRILPISRLETKSITERKNYIKDVIKIIKKTPIWGVGHNNYTLATEILNSNQKFYQPVHNIFLLSFAQWGIFAIIFWLFYLQTLITAWNNKNSIIFPFGIILIMILIIGMFDHYPLTEYSGLILLFLAVGVILSQNSTTHKSSKKHLI